MNKEEFKLFCHKEFCKRGFMRRNKMHYLEGKDVLCGIYLQKSMGDGFYVKYNFFIGKI